MGFRLTGFDYSRPYYYMVTLGRLPGRQALSALVAPGHCAMNALTKAFVHVIRCFRELSAAFPDMQGPSASLAGLGGYAHAAPR